MFTALQLQYLAEVQALDDWHCTYFPIAATKFWGTNSVPSIPHNEYREMQKILACATAEDLWHLQRALDHLNLLSISMFKNKENG
jgi:hypothetical protein